MTHWMRLFSITHSRADFVLYGVAVGAMAIFVALQAAPGYCAGPAALALGGVCGLVAAGVWAAPFCAPRDCAF